MNEDGTTAEFSLRLLAFLTAVVGMIFGLISFALSHAILGFLVASGFVVSCIFMLFAADVLMYLRQLLEVLRDMQATSDAEFRKKVA